MSSAAETPSDLRNAVIDGLKTVAKIGDVSAGAMADDLLRRISAAGYRFDHMPNQVFLAVTNPNSDAPPNGYACDAHASVHHTEAGAQRALDTWAANHPEYRGHVAFECNPVEIQE